jgi:precorrin-2 methylase
MQSTISASELLEPVDLQAYDLLADAQVVYLVDKSSRHEHLLFGADFIASTFRGPRNRVRFLRIECNRGTREEDLTRLWVSTVKGINPGRYA